MQLSDNFTLEELICSNVAQRNNINNVPELEQLNNLQKLCNEILQPVRDYFGKPIIVTSGYRCTALNKLVGGSSSSQHLKGEAADIITSGNSKEDNKDLFLLMKRMIDEGIIECGQLIDEKDYSWIHVSLPTESLRNQILHL